MSRHGPSANARLKFRVLCKRCNSYLRTTITVGVLDKATVLFLKCECGNEAKDLAEEFESE